jgi:glutaredoxin
MASAAHSDWMFDHSLHAHTPIDSHPDISTDTSHPIQTDSVASVLKTLWHHTDLMSGGSASPNVTLASTQASIATGAGKGVSPVPTITQSALTVTEGGSVSLPITVPPAGGHPASSVTIAGLTNYESVTDNLDHHVFSGNSITLSAAEVNSGLSLASAYAGTGHPVNTLTVTASAIVGGHTLTSAPQNIMVTDPAPSTPTPISSNTLTLQVSGDQYNGDPQIQVFVDGKEVGGTYDITADHSAGQTQTITIAGNFDPTVAHQVQIKFVNDAWDGTSWWSDGTSPQGHDRNVYVESISLNGATLNGVQGTDAATNGIAPAANTHEAVMDINGALTFAVADPAATTGGGSTGTGSTGTGATGTGSTGTGSSNTLTLQVSGDQYNGDPQIQVFVDGKEVGGTYDITADHSAGQTQTITIAGNFDPTVAHQVQIKFVNDAWDGTSWWSDGTSPQGHDRNVYVESISLNGATLTGNQGANAATNGVVHDPNANEAAMYTDGTATFNVAADPPTTTGSGSTGTGATGTGTTGTGSTGTGSTGTGSTGTGSTGTGAGTPPSGSGFYVSPNGSDSNPGTLAAPFATLARAQHAMENSSIKTTYIEGGTYHITSTINLTAADNGETWTYYAPNGVNSAVLDGGSKVDLFNINGGSNITIDGLKMQNVYDSAVSTGGARSNDIVLENCDIGFNQHTSAEGGFNAMVAFGNVTNAKILNNYVHNTASQGIALYAFYAGENVDGSVVSGNVVLNAVQAMSDGGAIYVDMRYTNVNGGHVTIENNYVKDYGNANVQAEGIYLDDDTSNATVTGNVIGAPAANMSSPVTWRSDTIINGGCANVWSDNIIDLGASGKDLVATWSAPGGGGAVNFAWTSPNVFEHNLIISDYAGGTNTGGGGTTNGVGFNQASGYPTSGAFANAISDNVYYNYGGGDATNIAKGTFIGDSHPVNENPLLSGYLYTLASNTPASNSPVDFTPIVGGWGPQGFVIPETGVAPSDLA